MNKKTKILIGCLALLLILSVGYALFSETITINGTATAKGSFDIEGNCITEFPEDFGSQEISGNYGYKNEICNVSSDANTVSYSVEFEYPGATKFYAYSFINNGTIKAELDANIVFESFAQEVIKLYDSKTNSLKETKERNGDFFSPVDVIFKDKSGNYVNSNDDLYINYFDEDNGKIYLDSKETMYIVMQSQWQDWEEYSQNGVYYEAKKTASFNWKQSTN